VLSCLYAVSAVYVAVAEWYTVPDMRSLPPVAAVYQRQLLSVPSL